MESDLGLLRRFLTEDSVFLEVGPGDCAVSRAVSEVVKQVYAIDVSSATASGIPNPDNFQLVVSDGTSIPVPSGTVDVAYSNQLMEHLHPDDAVEQLTNIYTALKPGGLYLCITPNRVNGPHDVSKYFDKVATGLHLREYATAELVALFRSVGFSVSAHLFTRGKSISAPLWVIRLFEAALGILPHAIRRRVTKTRPVKVLLQTIVIGRK